MADDHGGLRETDPGVNFIPKREYVGADVAQLEAERLWSRVWQMACRLDEIPEVGDYATYEICDESVLVVRTAPDAVSAYYNVCQHRGRRLKEEESGSAAGGFRCPYHGWRYSIDGALCEVPHREVWNDCAWFDEKKLGLKPVKADVWAGWAWINLDPQAEPLRDYLSPVPDYLDCFRFDDMQIGWWKTVIVPVNWKVVLDAFCEGYHSIATHPQFTKYGEFQWPGSNHGRHSTHITTFQPGPGKKDPTKPSPPAEMNLAMVEELYGTLFALAPDSALAAAKRIAEQMPDIDGRDLMQTFRTIQRAIVEASGAVWPEGLDSEKIEHAGTIWAIFPHSHILPAPDGALWYRFRPNGTDPNSMIFDIWRLDRASSGPRPKPKRQFFTSLEAFRGENPFLEQDFGNVLAVHRGMRSRGWDGAVLNPPEESMVANWHRAHREYLFGEGDA